MAHAAYDIRSARPADAPIVHALVRELAEHHDEQSEVVSQPEQIAAALGADPPQVDALLACDSAGDAVGLALFYMTYSTFKGRPGLYLEDLYVRPDHRGSGVGRLLLRELARVALDRDCCRIAWVAAEWNARGHAFYASLGAVQTTGSVGFQLQADALDRLANE